MDMYIIYDYNDFIAVFDSEEKMKKFIKKAKIKFIKIVGSDYLENEDYKIYKCKLNKGFEI